MVTQKVTALWIGVDTGRAEKLKVCFKELDAIRFSVTTVATIQEALSRLHSQQFSLAFVDSTNSEGNAEWEREFRCLCESLPVVLIVNDDNEERVFSALDKGALDYIHSEDANPRGLLKTIRHAIGSFHLLAELKRARQHDAMLKDQYLASQKMEAVGRLALGVAHDFNNLLTVIINYSQMVQKSAKDDETIRNRMEAITNCANRAASITSQFLAFGRRNKPAPRAVSVNSVLSIIEPLLKQSLGGHIELSISQASVGLSVFIDPNHLMHVVLGMAQNAQDCMTDGGSLSIGASTKIVGKENASALGEIVEGEYVVISIGDSGKGLDTETVEHIFELFGGEKNDGSTPAALSAINSIVKHANGHIDVQSEIGKGSRFDIYLPRHTQMELLTAEETTQPKEAKLLETILVVDDEEMVRKIAVEVITKQGYNVLEAENAIEALKLSEQRNEGIDLVLTDLIMPKMSGPELVQKMISKHPHLRVVYMSGYSDDAFEHNEKLEKRELFVQKPFLPKNLIGAVKEALQRTTSHSE